MIEVREPIVDSVRAAIVILRKRRIGPMLDGYYHVHGLPDPGGCEALARFFPERPVPVVVGLRVE